MEKDGESVTGSEETKAPPTKTVSEKDLMEESKDKWEAEDKPIITREDKKKNKPSAAKKRGFYKKCLKRSSATDDIDSIAPLKEPEATAKS